MTQPTPEAAACPACGYPGLVLIHTAPDHPAAYACILPECDYVHALEPEPPTPDHDPCCSSHGVPMTCERYRRTHFVEVRPCCAADAELLRAQA